MITTFFKGMTQESITQFFHPGHQALDIVAPYGTPLCAPENCLVTRISGDGPITTSTDGIKYGYGIHLKGLETGHTYLYWHCLPTFPVWGGDIVTRGQIVAYMGNAGYVTVGGRALTVEERDNLDENGNFRMETGGTHLHIQMEKDGKEIDPLPLINFNWQPTYTTADYIKAFLVVLTKNLKAIQ